MKNALCRLQCCVVGVAGEAVELNWAGGYYLRLARDVLS